MRKAHYTSVRGSVSIAKTIYLPFELAEVIRNRSEKLQISQNEFIRRAAVCYIEVLEAQPKKDGKKIS